MGFNSAFKGLKLLKKTGNGRLNNLNDPNRPQCVKNDSKNVYWLCKQKYQKSQKYYSIHWPSKGENVVVWFKDAVRTAQ